MTRLKWTQPDQEKWLKALGKDFRIAEQENTRKAFFSETYRQWLLKWPNRTPTQADLERAKTHEKAVKDIYDLTEKHIKTWFRNHKRPAMGGNKDGAGSSRASKGVLKLKKKRMWHSWQAYHDLTYDEIWKPIIDVEWDYYIMTWKAEHGDAPLTINRFTFMNAFMKARYEDDDEIKERVEEHRQKINKPPPAEVNASYQQSIEMLPRSLANFADSIYEQTGWVVSFMMGGPTPSDNGKISTLIYHSEKDGKDFENYMGKAEFQELVGKKYEDFLHDAFTPEDCAARALEDESNKGVTDDEDAEGKNETEEDGSDVDDVEKRPSKGISEYERTKHENIAQNKLLLMQAANEAGLGKFVEDSTKVDTKKRSSKKKAETGQKAAESARVSTRQATKNSSVASGDGSSSGLGGDGKEKAAPKSPESQDGSSGGSGGDGKEEAAPSAKKSSESPPAVANEANSLTDGPVTDLNAMDIDNQVDNGVMGKDAVPAKDAKSIEDSEHVTSPDDQRTTLGQSLSSTTRASDPPSHSHEGATTSTTSSTISPSTISSNSHGLPSFLSAAMITYLRSVSTSSPWQDLLTEYLDFEREGPITGKLSTNSRPDLVTPWIKRHANKKHEPVDVEQNDFGSQFCAWWTAIQPTWRILPGGQYSRVVPDNETWASLRKGGSAGLFVVVVALSWWVRAAEDVVDQLDLCSIIGDLHWVIQQVRGLKQAEKRARSETDTARKGKRRRV